MRKKISCLLFWLIFFYCLLCAKISEIINLNFDLRQGEKFILELRYNIPEGQYSSLQEDYLYIEIEEQDGITNGKTIYPDNGTITEYGYMNYYQPIILQKEIIISRTASVGEHEIKVYFSFQRCLTDGTCLIPEEEEHVLYLNITEGMGNEVSGAHRFGSMFYFLLLAFVGGIILNLTPCVLPVLTMRAMSLVKQSQETPQIVIKNSVLYSIGILVCFTILALFIIGIKLSGELIGWGFQNQNPTFVIFLYAILFLFSLSLFDVFVINAPGVNAATQASNQKGYLGSFFMGMFAVLLGTPCMAPFLGSAIGFALAQSPIMILSIFILVGLGFAFPFLLISIFPKSVRILPKPGNWMTIFKEVLAFILLIFAVDQLNTLVSLMGGRFLINMLYFSVILSFTAWLYGKFITPMYGRRTQWIIIIVIAFTLVSGANLLLRGKVPGSETMVEPSDNYWSRFSSEAVQAAIEEGLPVFIDFTADWCKNCKTNEKLVLNTSDIKAAFSDKGVVMFKGDYTRRDDEIMNWLMRYNRAGVPLYLLFIPGEEEPIVFPELITKQMVFKALNQLK